jgi:hypothetical protein
MISVKLRLTGAQHEVLKAHLFPGDGCEAVAVALCGRRHGDAEQCLTVRKIVPIPYDACVRNKDTVRWPTESLLPLLKDATKDKLAVLKIHGHPNGVGCFSQVDDTSDRDLFASIFGWTECDDPHASAIVLPDGKMIGRAIFSSGEFVPLSCIAVAGDDLHFWYPGEVSEQVPGFTLRHAQLFGTGTTTKLRRLAVAVVGCSRLGVGRLVLVDPDRVEQKNLNRILNATLEDAYLRRLKVEVLARAIARMGFGTEVTLVPENLISPVAVKAVAGCDVVLGCMDGAEGRHVLNRLAAFYVLPYFDVGIRLDADGQGGIEQVCGAVHYIQPDRSSLLERGVYTMKQVEAEGLKRTDPAAYREQVKLGYIHGVQEERPAVISVNMQLASMAVNEFLARLHPYRYNSNREFAAVRTSLIQAETYREEEGASHCSLARHVGRGDVQPLLEMPALSHMELCR